jgi:ATP-dependent Zn protease
VSIQPSEILPPALPAVHEPAPDDREPKRRRKLMFWDRVKVLFLLAVIFGFFVSLKKADIPIMSWGEAFQEELRNKWWLVALFGLEVIRQIHNFLGERWSAYYMFWQNHVWGAWNRRVDRMAPWPRYRINRLFRLVVWITIGAFFFGGLWGVTPLQAIAEAPSRLWNNPFGTGGMPWFFQIFFVMFIAVIQFVAIFWFMSRGGVETYMPEEVKTRYDDVWGQDHVLGKVKENIELLEAPDTIEDRGGHVPSGILLWGPPGTGKTLMAEAVAGETGKPYVFVDPGAFQAMFFGVGILKVKALFRKLRKLSLRYGGVIVFFDEADSLGNRGAPVAQGASEHAHVFGEGTCNGIAYLSTPAHQVLVRRALDSAPATDAEAPRSIRDRVIMGGMGMGGGGMGTLQALLAELSGLKKPRGFINRRVRQYLNMKPKQPPKYRILVMMATNMPDSLDAALLRPGRIDRSFKVGYPSMSGRIRTYRGYLDKVRNVITDENLERIALMTPYATGASIKDMVNEALLVAMREERDVVTWPDLLRARQNLRLGPSEGFEYVERERHAVAIHEACHAVAAYRLRRHYMIDMATIERRGDTGGFVSSVPPEDRFTHWRSEYEIDIICSVASLAGERLLFAGDNSSGVGGDMHQATQLLMEMHAFWGMGPKVASHAATKVARHGITSRPEDGVDRNVLETEFGRHVEGRLEELVEQARVLLEANRRFVFAVAHALEVHQTITGEDITAIFEGVAGPKVDGQPYHTDDFLLSYEAYHLAAAEAHREHAVIQTPLPALVPAAANGTNGHAHAPWAPPAPRNGNGHP